MEQRREGRKVQGNKRGRIEFMCIVFATGKRREETLPHN